ncbi:hypothetical protein SAMN06296008_10847 [Polynucleobacter kasalickyi]|uniref:Uncharacterized protein n=2 Tax=Polynucleobacter kasalickyi TaxID=1938817 RepID=A0A1W2AAP6_9BURK|nr:hypothetical protein SAMN06296008_10847 [Polynucleobacter kasalickyi]
MLLVLSGGIVYQSHLLFLSWQQQPKKDYAAWRLEYADMHSYQATITDREQASTELTSANQSLEIQLHVNAPTEYPFFAKKIALPNMEILLSNVNGEPLAYQELTPSQWLGADPKVLRYLTKGVASQTQITVNIPLVLPEAASGFQIQMVYPH